MSNLILSFCPQHWQIHTLNAYSDFGKKCPWELDLSVKILIDFNLFIKHFISPYPQALGPHFLGTLSYFRVVESSSSPCTLVGRDIPTTACPGDIPAAGAQASSVCVSYQATLMLLLLVSTLKTLQNWSHKLKWGPQIASYKVCYSWNAFLTLTVTHFRSNKVCRVQFEGPLFSFCPNFFSRPLASGCLSQEICKEGEAWLKGQQALWQGNMHHHFISNYYTRICIMGMQIILFDAVSWHSNHFKDKAFSHPMNARPYAYFRILGWIRSDSFAESGLKGEICFPGSLFKPRGKIYL